MVIYPSKGLSSPLDPYSYLHHFLSHFLLKLLLYTFYPNSSNYLSSTRTYTLPYFKVILV